MISAPAFAGTGFRGREFLTSYGVFKCYFLNNCDIEDVDVDDRIDMDSSYFYPTAT
jgi:hypothetical protein